MRKITRILTDKKGTSTLTYSAVVLVFLCMVTILSIATAEFRTLTLSIADTAEQALDEYVTAQSIEQFESIKNSTDYTIELDEQGYIDLLTQALSMDSNLTGSTGNGRTFTISEVDLQHTEDLDFTVTLHLVMPFEVFDSQIMQFDQDITISSKYTQKF